MDRNPYPQPEGGHKPSAEWLAWNEGFVAAEDAQTEPDTGLDRWGLPL